MKARTLEDVIDDKRYTELPTLHKDFIIDLMRSVSTDIKEHLSANLNKLLKEEDFIEELSALVWAKMLEVDSPTLKDSNSLKRDSIITPRRYRNYKEIRKVLHSYVPKFIDIFGNREFPIAAVVAVLEADLKLSAEEKAIVPNKSYTRFHSRVVSVCTDSRWDENPFESVRKGKGVYRLKTEC